MTLSEWVTLKIAAVTRVKVWKLELHQGPLAKSPGRHLSHHQQHHEELTSVLLSLNPETILNFSGVVNSS